MEQDKCMENLLRAAFTRGYVFGSHYPDPAAIPIGEADIQFQAWWDDWRGNTWTSEQWLAARIEKGLARPDLESINRSIGEQMGHVGGHYG